MQNNQQKPETLAEHIANNYNSKVEFSRVNGVIPQMVTKWLNAGWIIVDSIAYSPRRKFANFEGKIADKTSPPGLRKYIADNYKNKAVFARAIGVHPNQVGRWYSWIVFNGMMYSPKRSVADIKNKAQI